MTILNARMLASASVAAIATVAFVGVAQAQTAPVTQTEAEQCAKLPTAAEQQACVEAQAKDARGAEESGQADTIAPEERTEQKAETEGAIVVTGSRIRRSAFSNSPDPLTVIDPEVSLQKGDIETAEVLQSTPVASGSTQITSFLSSNFVFNGGAGVQTLSLRGLGAERTLVLLDGRRAGPAGVRGAVAAFDLNVLPTSIVRSVEIVKTGASSVYGSDAIAGVVNILTKRDTDGIELRAFGSLPEKSGGETYDVSATWGKEFSRGHILLSGSFFRRNELERRDRDFLGCTIDYIFNPTGQRVDLLDPRTGEPSCQGDAFGNAIAVTDFSPNVGGGTNLGTPPGAQFPIGIIQFNDPGTQTNVYGFPIPVAANSRQFTAPAGFYGVNVNANSTGILHLFDTDLARGASIVPKTTRYTAFASGSYEVTDNVELFADLLYNRRETVVDGPRQFFPQQFTSSTHPALVNAFCPLTTTFGSPNPYCDRTDTGDPFNVGFTGAQVLQPVIIVPFNTDQKVDYYRGVAGARGEVSFLKDRPWRWEAWGQYSRSDGTYSTDIIFQDAVDALVFRTNSCAGRTTEIRGAPCVDINLTDPRVLAGNFTDAERAFLFGRDTGNTRYTQLTGEASMSGEVMDLWAGPLQASIGVHLRRDEIKDVPGEATQRGNSWQLTRSGVTAGHTITSEAFGEVSLPLFVDRPLVGSAELTGAARITNYYAERADGVSDKDNGNWTYKIGANWAVNDWLRLRATYGTSYRAPALFEQFLADETSFAGQTAIDPCINYAVALANGAITQNIAEACAAQGVPNNYTGGGTSSAVVARGGGVGVLDPETSRALTTSVIFTPPPVWDGMRVSFAVDYFEIKVKGEITPLGAANIVRSCLDSDTFPNDIYCGLFERINDPLNPRDNQIISVRNPFVNINKQLNRGIDFTLRFSQNMGSWGDFSFLGQATWQIEDRIQLFENNPLNPGGNSRISGNNNGEAGDPKWIADLNFTWQKKPFTVVYGIDYIGATSDRYDARRANGDDLCANNTFRGVICPDFRLERTFYHSASVNFDFMKRYKLTLGVSNIFDTDPPRISRLNSGSGGNIGDGVALLGSQYDYLGRRFFAGITAKF